jgi:hypothetical protein
MGHEQLQQREFGPGQFDQAFASPYLTASAIKPEIGNAQRAVRWNP